MLIASLSSAKPGDCTAMVAERRPRDDSFTGITAYFKNSGLLEHAQHMAGHAEPKTTKLYDRRQQEVTQEEVERIVF